MRRFEAKKVFLTYQHIEREPTLNLETLLTFFTASLPELESHTLGLEDYPTETGQHIHVLLRFSRKERFPFDRFNFGTIVPFNEAFRGGARKDILAVHRYCIKDGTFLTNFTAPDSQTNKWPDILASATKEEALEIFIANYPRDAVLSRRHFDYWTDVHFKPLPIPYIAREGFVNIPDVLLQWREEQLSTDRGLDRPTGLILVGPTRLGKTEYVRSWGNHIYWGGGTTIRDCDWGTAEYLVVDDVPWEYFVGKKQFLGGQKSFILTEKYVRKTRITFGKPCVYISNSDPFMDMSEEEKEYFGENVKVIFLTNKLY